MIEVLKIGLIILTSITSFIFGVVFTLAVRAIAYRIKKRK
jgi:hypothetical protein